MAEFESKFLAGGPYLLHQQLYQDGAIQYWHGLLAQDGNSYTDRLIQLPLPIFVRHPQRLRQLRLQAKHHASLRHKNIAPLEFAHIESDLTYLVFRLSSGVSLYHLNSNLMARGQKLSWPTVLEIALQLCELLEVVHSTSPPSQTGLSFTFCGDLRPESLFVNWSGELQLFLFYQIDLWGDLVEAWPDVVLRRYAYSSPERWQNKLHYLAPSTDLFSVGVLLYELLTGQLPFTGSSVEKVRKEILSSSAVPVQNYRPEIPQALELLIQQLLHPNAGMRLRKASDVKGMIEQILYHYAPSEEKNRTHRKSELAKIAHTFSFIIPQGNYASSERLNQIDEFPNFNSPLSPPTVNLNKPKLLSQESLPSHYSAEVELDLAHEDDFEAQTAVDDDFEGVTVVDKKRDSSDDGQFEEDTAPQGERVFSPLPPASKSSDSFNQLYASPPKERGDTKSWLSKARESLELELPQEDTASSGPTSPHNPLPKEPDVDPDETVMEYPTISKKESEKVSNKNSYFLNESTEEEQLESLLMKIVPGEEEEERTVYQIPDNEEEGEQTIYEFQMNNSLQEGDSTILSPSNEALSGTGSPVRSSPFSPAGADLPGEELSPPSPPATGDEEIISLEELDAAVFEELEDDDEDEVGEETFLDPQIGEETVIPSPTYRAERPVVVVKKGPETASKKTSSIRDLLTSPAPLNVPPNRQQSPPLAGPSDISSAEEEHSLSSSLPPVSPPPREGLTSPGGRLHSSRTDKDLPVGGGPSSELSREFGGVGSSGERSAVSAPSTGVLSEPSPSPKPAETSPSADILSGPSPTPRSDGRGGLFPPSGRPSQEELLSVLFDDITPDSSESDGGDGGLLAESGELKPLLEVDTGDPLKEDSSEGAISIGEIMSGRENSVSPEKSESSEKRAKNSWVSFLLKFLLIGGGALALGLAVSLSFQFFFSPAGREGESAAIGGLVAERGAEGDGGTSESASRGPKLPSPGAGRELTADGGESNPGKKGETSETSEELLAPDESDGGENIDVPKSEQ